MDVFRGREWVYPDLRPVVQSPNDLCFVFVPPAREIVGMCLQTQMT